MARAPDVEVDEAEASLISRIHSKGLLHLGLDEVEAAYRSKAFPDKWQRVTGTRMPEQLLVDMTERLRRVNRLRDDASAAADPSAPGAALAFLKAAAAGELAAVRRWLESRERRHLLDASDEQQRGCAHLAARAGHVEVLSLLCDHGALLDARDRFGRTPLHLACEYGRLAAARLLLDAGGSAGAADRSGRTALHFAACCEDAEICRLLLARQPSLVNCVDGHGRTSLFYSVLNVNTMAQEEITRLLLERKAEVNARDSSQRAPLHYAAEEGKKPAVGLLLRLQADPLAEDGLDGRTPLQMASTEAVRHELRRAGGARPPAPAAPQPQPTPSAPSAAVAGPPLAAAAGSGPGRPSAAVLAESAPFQELQARFVKIMERVQQGGVEQMEHIKRPHLFTGSWMVDVDSHQKLLGQVLKSVPGPEACIRVFNLLRPPSQFPLSRGDERDIISYYTHDRDSAKASAAQASAEAAEHSGVRSEDPMSQVSRVELLRVINEQRRQLEAREGKAEDLQQQLEKLQAELVETVDHREAALLKARLQKAQSQLTTHSEELDEARGEAHLFEGQVRGLSKQLKEEKEKVVEMLAERRLAQQQLEQSEQWRQGVERQQAEVFQSQLERQLRDAEAERTTMVAARYELQSEVRLLQDELRQRRSEAAAEMEAQRTRSGMVEFQLRSELGAAQQLAGELQAARAEMAAEASGRRALAGEAGVLQSELQAARGEAAAAARLEAKVTQLEWEKEDLDKHYRMLFSRYNLVGQLFLGNQQPPEAAVPALDATVVSQPGATIRGSQALAALSASAAVRTGQSVAAPPLEQPDASVSAGAVQFASQPAVDQPPPASASQDLEATQLPGGPILRHQAHLDEVLKDPVNAQAAAGQGGPVLRHQGHLEDVLKDPVNAQAAAGLWQPQPDSSPGGAQDPAVATTSAPSRLTVKIASASGLRNADWMGKSDPYCVCYVLGKPNSKFQTKVVNNSLSPEWNHEGAIDGFEAGDSLVFEVWDSDPGKKDDFLGKATVLGSRILPDGCSEKLALTEAGKEGAFLNVSMKVASGGAKPEPEPASASQPQPQAPQTPGGPLRRQAPLEEVLLNPCAAQAAAGEPIMPPDEAAAGRPEASKAKDPGVTAASSSQQIVVKIVSAKGLRNADWMGKSDPYCVCQVPGKPSSKFQTKVVSNNLDPEWNHEAVIKGFEAGDSLLFEVWDSDPGKKDDFLGKATILGSDISAHGGSRALLLAEAGKEGAFLNVVVKVASGDAAPALEPVSATPSRPQALQTAGVAQPQAPQTTAAAQPPAQQTSGGALRRQAPLEEVLLNPSAAQAAAGEPPVRPDEAAAAGRPEASKAKEAAAAAAAAGAPSKSQPQPAAGSRTEDPKDAVASAPMDIVVKIVSAKGLRNADWMGKSDPYCICQVPGKPGSKFQTKVVDNNLDPEWNHEGTITGFQVGDSLVFEVWDSDPGKKDDFLGKATILGKDILPHGGSKALPLADAGKEGAFLNVTVAVASGGSKPKLEPAPIAPKPEPQTPQTAGGALLRRQAPLEEVLANPCAAQAAAGEPLMPPDEASKAKSAAAASTALAGPSKPQPQPAAGGPPAAQAAAGEPAAPPGKAAAGRPEGPETKDPAPSAAVATPDAVAAKKGAPPAAVAEPATKPQPAEIVVQDPGAAMASAPPRIVVNIVSAKGLRNADWVGKSDPYCVCHVPGKPDSKFQTKVVNDNLDPEWNHEGVIKNFEANDSLVFEVWDSDFGKKDDFLGKAKILGSDIFPHGCSQKLPLSEAGKEGAFLNVTVKVSSGGSTG